MTEQIFDMDNGFWRTVGKAGDMVLLTFLTFITSIPVITAGTSFCALYYVAFKILEDDNRSTIKNFFHSFRENLLQGMVLTVCMGAVMTLSNVSKTLLSLSYYTNSIGD